MHKKAVELGKHLVARLGDEHDSDVLSNWMAHYIAEQISLAESCDGSAKVEAEEKCFKTILQLWKHRASLPRGKKPFEQFDVIFQVLAGLDPDASLGFYWQLFKPKVVPKPGSVEEMGAVITALDKAARVLIEYALSLAVDVACDKNDIELLNDALPTEDDSDVDFISQLTHLGINRDMTPERIKELAVERVRDRIETLDWFEAAAKELRRHFNEELHRRDQS